ncbi:hypothetical protein BB020_08045 [Elizabethkingia occulta]|nr:hypothetical protein BB020_08045 [Elizabethkingia occulta]
MRFVLFGILIVLSSIFLNCKNRVVETKNTTLKDSMAIRSKLKTDSVKMKRLSDSTKLVTPKIKDSLKMNK